MKEIFDNIRRWLKQLAAIAVAGAALTASAQVTPTKVYTLTNIPPQFNANSLSNLFTVGSVPSNNVIPVTQGAGLSFSLEWNGGNSADSLTVAMNWAASVDGSNYFPLPNSSVSALGNGLGTALLGSNMPAGMLNNLAYITPYQITNGNAHTITLTNAAAGVVGATNGAAVAGVSLAPLPY